MLGFLPIRLRLDVLGQQSIGHGERYRPSDLFWVEVWQASKVGSHVGLLAANLVEVWGFGLVRVGCNWVVNWAW